MEEKKEEMGGVKSKGRNTRKESKWGEGDEVEERKEKEEKEEGD